MGVSEIKDSVIEFGSNQIENLKEVDWQGVPVKVLDFGKEQGSKVLEGVKNDSFLTTFRKAYRVAEMIPYVNAWAGLGRILYSVAYGAKVTAASWTVRPFTEGITGTFKKYWMEEMPYIIKQFARGALIGHGASWMTNNDTGALINLASPWKTALATAAYDFATNNVEFLKNSRFVPNYWA